MLGLKACVTAPISGHVTKETKLRSTTENNREVHFIG